MFSETALKIYALVKNGTIVSNAQFWKRFYDPKFINDIEVDLEIVRQEVLEKNINLVCCLDKDFPVIINDIKPSERPFLFVYKGDIKLLHSIDNNVAVIGVLTPTEDIVFREGKIIKKLVLKDKIIISGLAKGCDTIAHKKCICNCGKTVAILPTTLDNIYPKENLLLSNEIVLSGGLVITEYITEPKNNYQKISRFIERDRLQAMFSESVILIASYRKGTGDSGSRHAMQKAKEYGRSRYVMFNRKLDANNAIFGLNEDLLKDGVRLINE